MRIRVLCACLLLCLWVVGGSALAAGVQDGDIIFQTSKSSQSAAIRAATHSRYTHMGIIFLRGGQPYVFEARRRVQFTPLEQWGSSGVGGHYVVKRLRDAGTVLTPQALARLRREAARYTGKPYDLFFDWSDDAMYCSELVWKIYERALGIRIGSLRKLRDFDLSAREVRAKLHERYGDQIPLDEKMIAPADMFDAPRLQTIVAH